MQNNFNVFVTEIINFHVGSYIYNCGLPTTHSSMILKYNSTWEGSLLTYRCRDGLVPDDLLTAVCNKGTNWLPDLTNHTCAAPSAGNQQIYTLCIKFNDISFVNVSFIYFHSIIRSIEPQYNNGYCHFSDTSCMSVLYIWICQWMLLS